MHSACGERHDVAGVDEVVDTMRMPPL